MYSLGGATLPVTPYYAHEYTKKLDEQSKHFEAEIKAITEAIMKPKSLSVNRGADGKISDITVAHQADGVSK